MYFQKGFGLKAEVSPILARTYQSAAIDRLKQLGYDASAGAVRFKLAREFGFCYGVDRAVEYAYETRRRFPDRRVFLSGEIIHNPDVNSRVRGMGIEILPDSKDPIGRYVDVVAGDVVILPAFGVTVAEMTHLQAKQCVLVDTTCGSVLNVWKMVHRCARDGYTVVIHGKHYHEETRATASQTKLHDGGQYLCVRNTQEAAIVCAFIRQEIGADRVLASLGSAAGPGFDPERDLARIGLANQTTMLMTESFEIQEMLRIAMQDSTAPVRLNTASGRSIRSARRPRSGRTRSLTCSRPAAWTSCSWSADTTAAIPRRSRRCAPRRCRRFTSRTCAASRRTRSLTGRWPAARLR